MQYLRVAPLSDPWYDRFATTSSFGKGPLLSLFITNTSFSENLSHSFFLKNSLIYRSHLSPGSLAQHITCSMTQYHLSRNY